MSNSRYDITRNLKPLYADFRSCSVKFAGETNGYVLTYDGIGQSWYGKPAAGGVSITAGTGLTATPSPITSTGTISLNAVLNDLTDVTITSAALDNVLRYNGTQWVNLPLTAVSSINTGLGLTGGPITSTGTIALSATLDNLTDVTVTSPANGQILSYNGSQWVNAVNPADGVTSITAGTGLAGGTITSVGTISLNANLDNLTDVVITGTPSTSQVLQYNGTSWVNATLPAGTTTTVTSSDSSLLVTGGPAYNVRLNQRTPTFTDNSTRSGLVADALFDQYGFVEEVFYKPFTLPSTASNSDNNKWLRQVGTSTTTTTYGDLDFDEVRVGNNNSSNNATTIADVQLSGLANNQVLQYNDSTKKWVNATLPAVSSGTVTQVNTGTGLSGGPITTTGTISLNAGLDDLNDVDLTANEPLQTAFVLSYNATDGYWYGRYSVLNDNSDVEISGPTTGQVLRYNGSQWVNATLTLNAGTVTSITAGTGLAGGTITGSGTISLNAGLDNLTDVVISSVAINNILQYNGVNWVNTAPSNQFNIFNELKGGAGPNLDTITVYERQELSEGGLAAIITKQRAVSKPMSDGTRKVVAGNSFEVQATTVPVMFQTPFVWGDPMAGEADGLGEIVFVKGMVDLFGFPNTSDYFPPHIASETSARLPAGADLDGAPVSETNSSTFPTGYAPYRYGAMLGRIGIRALMTGNDIAITNATQSDTAPAIEGQGLIYSLADQTFYPTSMRLDTHLSDVQVSTPSQNQVLMYDSGSGDWINRPISIGHFGQTSSFNDILNTAYADGQVLRYNASAEKWINVKVNLSQSMFDNVTMNTVMAKQVLSYDPAAEGGKWTNKTLSLGYLSDIDFVTSLPQADQVLRYDGTMNVFYPGGAVVNLKAGNGLELVDPITTLVVGSEGIEGPAIVRIAARAAPIGYDELMDGPIDRAGQGILTKVNFNSAGQGETYYLRKYFLPKQNVATNADKFLAHSSTTDSDGFVNLEWRNVVTGVTAGTGLTGGTITSTGTINLAGVTRTNTEPDNGVPPVSGEGAICSITTNSFGQITATRFQRYVWPLVNNGAAGDVIIRIQTPTGGVPQGFIFKTPRLDNGFLMDTPSGGFTASSGHILRHNGTTWASTAAAINSTVFPTGTVGGISTNATTTGQVLRYNTAINGGNWVPTSPTLSSGFLPDVSISSPANDQFLRYNGSAWVNSGYSAGYLMNISDAYGFNSGNVGSYNTFNNGGSTGINLLGDPTVGLELWCGQIDGPFSNIGNGGAYNGVFTVSTVNPSFRPIRLKAWVSVTAAGLGTSNAYLYVRFATSSAALASNGTAFAKNDLSTNGQLFFRQGPFLTIPAGSTQNAELDVVIPSWAFTSGTPTHFAVGLFCRNSLNTNLSIPAVANTGWSITHSTPVSTPSGSRTVPAKEPICFLSLEHLFVF